MSMGRHMASLLWFAGLSAGALVGTSAAAEGTRGWDAVPAILDRIKPPVFPDRDCLVTDHGAVAGPDADNTEALRQAIAKCHAAGGGRVVVPPGLFRTGAIHLRSNVNLHVSQGALLQFISDPAKYLPLVFTRFEGTECMNYSPLIYAFEQENVAVTGKGVLDGGGGPDNWWPWKNGPDRPSIKRLLDMNARGVPVAERIFGPGHFLRSSFIQTYRCRNVLIEGVTIHNSPMWEIHPVLSTNVTVRGVTVSTHGPNNDGCNPESSRDVLIEDSVFDTGDDCIAIKSGRNDDGRRLATPSENIVIRRCTMKDGHGGVTMGSEVSGGVRNVFVEKCRMDSPNLDRALRFKSNAQRGGIVENVYFREVEIGRVSEAVVTVDFLYETGPDGPHRPVVRNVVLEQVTSEAAPRLLWAKGFPGAIIDGLRFVDSVFRGVEAGDVMEHVGGVELRNVTIVPAGETRSRNSVR
jgi:unsaturated rhamnogalacturonyl hydrolase